jgi:glucose/arabinose dehydrogenase
MRRTSILFLIAGLAAPAVSHAQAPACEPGNAGLTLPKGFCATIFADSVPRARQLVVAPNGDVFVSAQRLNGVTVLRDANHDGRADSREKFVTGFSSSHVALFDGHLYVEAEPQGAEGRTGTASILRYALNRGEPSSAGAPDTIVQGLPFQPGHFTRNFVITREGTMYVNVGSGTNSCQPQAEDRRPGAKGVDPCLELRTRAGIWQFDARKLHQTQASGQHFATGIRNGVGIAINPTDHLLWVTQHGRDGLGDWKELGLTPKQSAEMPAEELFQVGRGDNFGWPYCYLDPFEKKKVLAPEYGGNGKEVGRCAQFKRGVASFPGHWAPNALLFYTGSTFPARYKAGAFIAFHGSWNRAPEPQGGYNVIFQPLRNGRATGSFEVFADGFAPNLNTARSQGNGRPSGLAQGPDGALYVADDALGRIYRIVYTGR